MEIEQYFNTNGVGALGVTEPQSGSSNSYFVGFALAAALILWMRRRQDEDDDTLFVKQNNRSWADLIRDPLNRRRNDHDDNDFDEII